MLDVLLGIFQAITKIICNYATSLPHAKGRWNKVQKLKDSLQKECVYDASTKITVKLSSFYRSRRWRSMLFDNTRSPIDRDRRLRNRRAPESRFSVLAPFFSPLPCDAWLHVFRLKTSRAERGRSGNVKQRSGSVSPRSRAPVDGKSASRARECVRARSPSGSRRRSAAFACSPVPPDRRPAKRSPASPSSACPSGSSRSRCHGLLDPPSFPRRSPARSPAASSLRIGGYPIDDEPTCTRWWAVYGDGYRPLSRWQKR